MKTHSSYRHTDEAKKLLAKIAFKWGVSRTAALEIMIRRIAEKELK